MPTRRILGAQAIGETGAIKVTADFRTSDPHIYAVGDAIEVYQSLTHKPVRLPLAGPALRQARAAADAMYGMHGINKGVIGSCAVRIFELNAAATGLNEKNANAKIYLAILFIPLQWIK